MLIIIEGVDKVGKTTLLSALSKKEKCIVIKNCHRPSSGNDLELKKSYETIYEFIKANHKKYNIILDRFYPSQIVYSTLRGSDSFNDKWYNKFENKLTKLKHLYVYCYLDLSIILSRHQFEADEYVQSKNLRKLIQRYQQFYNKTKLKKIRLNLRPEKFDTNLNLIVAKIKHG